VQVDAPLASDGSKENKEQQQQQQQQQLLRHRPPTPVYLSLAPEPPPALVRPHSANASNIISRYFYTFSPSETIFLPQFLRAILSCALH
jgi:hypothetical protein